MKLLFLGDFYYDYDYITEDIKKIAKYIKDNKYITILNLEGTIKTRSKLNKGVNLAFSDTFIDVLNLLNVKAVNLANNHVMDYGKDGLKLLIKKLDNAKIGHFGAGLDLEEACKPYILKEKGKKIAFGGYGWNMEECICASKISAGTAGLNFNKIANIISNTNCDIFVPVFHYGYEYESLPQPLHLIETRKLLENDKVKIIIGHHPHVVQAYENKIYYSLGNFYFGSRRDVFYNDNKYSKETSFGIGVVYDLLDDKKEIIEILYDGKKSIISDNTNKLLNISNIKTIDYEKYFYENNRFLNKKYVYKNGFFNEKIINKLKYFSRNSRKKYLKYIKWPLIKIIKKIFKIKN
ncbi:MAG: CapA family protein [Bacilli bacterium]|nr:CapA family protein [Bacilli bacterium]